MTFMHNPVLSKKIITYTGLNAKALFPIVNFISHFNIIFLLFVVHSNLVLTAFYISSSLSTVPEEKNEKRDFQDHHPPLGPPGDPPLEGKCGFPGE